MTYKRKILVLYLTIFISLATTSSSSDVMAKPRESAAKTTIKATIASRYNLRLFGYTAANSIVQANASRVFAQTASDANGYFIFYDIPISYEAREICITTIDSSHRTGFPTCINLPITTHDTEIGPVLLAPTISISRGKIWQNDSAFASGKTIPNQEVVISFFEVAPATLAFSPIRQFAQLLSMTVYAEDLPRYTTISNDTGDFSFSLPTSKSLGYRVFAKAIYEKQPTPKSQTLSFAIGSWLEYFYQYTLPWLLFWIMLFILAGIAIRFELKTRFFRDRLSIIIETKLRPIAVRRFVKLKRIWYNLRDLLKSNQTSPAQKRQ